MPVENLRLTFDGGRVTGITADTNADRLKAFLATTSDRAKELSLVDIGTNPMSHPLEGSTFRSWEMGGLVTVTIGANVWAGGDNDAAGGMTFHLSGATLEVAGEKLVDGGVL